MGLQDKLATQGSTLSNLNGGTASVPIFKNSKLHNEYSINDTPNIPGKPSPSDLDLGGVKPTSANKDATTLSINNTFKDGVYNYTELGIIE
tara:strand:- start:252 stop:524 length:273 start_codon:yes stop_codon:yes gene_type:complete